MLEPRIELSQKYGECNYINIVDATGDWSIYNPGGYGGENAAADEVTAIDFIVTVNGISYEVDKGLLPCGSVKLSPLDLYKVVPNPGNCECIDCSKQPDCDCGDKAAVEVNCSTPASSPPNFADGCITIQTRVWMKCLSLQTRCTYTMSTESALASVQKLYVEFNGNMVQVSPSIVGTTVSFSQFDTLNVFGKWELRNAQNGIDQAGLFTQSDCADYEIAGPPKPYSIQNQTFLVTCNTDGRLKKLADRNLDGSKDKITDKFDFNTILALAISRFGSINDCKSDCKCAESKLTIINRQLDKIDR